MLNRVLVTLDVDACFSPAGSCPDGLKILTANRSALSPAEFSGKQISLLWDEPLKP